MYKWSVFCIREVLPNGEVLLKSLLTGSVVMLPSVVLSAIDCWINDLSQDKPEGVNDLMGENALIVSREIDEWNEWCNRFLDTRNNKAHIFILHFLPTIQCQFRCEYCFEKGINRKTVPMSDIVTKSTFWLEKYLDRHPEVDMLRLVFFGGEPLLREDIVCDALEHFHLLADRCKIEFHSELITNGELLNEKLAQTFAVHCWHKVQITLDGPREVHDRRRHGTHNRPTFDNVVRTIRMLLSTDYIQKVGVRISLDSDNADFVPELIRYLASLGKTDRIDLSLGLTTPSLGVEVSRGSEEFIADKTLHVWLIAKSFGFKIPEDFTAGPWCVAVAKHSAVMQPNGFLQKCFCTVGRPEYNFGHVSNGYDNYTQDPRFEQFRRTNQCIEEKCAYLPVCGGGCIHDAIVANNGPAGFSKRFCQRKFVEKMNRGLLLLNYT